MVKEEKFHLGDLVKSVEHLAKEKMKLYRELNRHCKKSNNDSIPDNIPEGMPLMQVKSSEAHVWVFFQQQTALEPKFSFSFNYIDNRIRFLMHCSKK